jgi:hypothetical protein
MNLFHFIAEKIIIIVIIIIIIIKIQITNMLELCDIISNFVSYM